MSRDWNGVPGSSGSVDDIADIILPEHRRRVEAIRDGAGPGVPAIQQAGRQLLESSLVAWLHAASEPRHIAQVPEAKLLGELILSLVDTSDTRSLVALYPHLASGTLAAVVALMSEVATVSAELRRDMAGAVRRTLRRGSEQLPYRQLERRWVLSKLGEGLRWPPQERPRGLLIASPPPLVQMRSVDLDALTHAIWYVTDFGRLPAPGWVPRTDLARIIDGLIARHIEDDEQLIELAATRLALDIEESELSKAAEDRVSGFWSRFCSSGDSGVFEVVCHQGARFAVYFRYRRSLTASGVLSLP